MAVTTKRAKARAARQMAKATRVVGNKEGNGKGHGQLGQWQW
jgi:hypothetical protein